MIKLILKILAEVFGTISSCSAITLVVIGLLNLFNISEIVLIAICSSILYLGVAETLKRIDKKKEEKEYENN